MYCGGFRISAPGPKSDVLTPAAMAYHKEPLRDDGFHGARMFQREESLRRAIERFNDAQAPISEVSDEKTKLI